MKRRDFIKFGMGGLAAITVGSVVMPPIFTRQEAHAATLTLTITEVLHEMVDLNQIYSWAFSGPTGPSIPGPVIFVQQGEAIDLTVVNLLDEDHAFTVEGTNPLVTTGPIAPGRQTRLRFTLNQPGTYLYLDSVNAPVNRVLGLHGVLVVLPNNPVTPYGDLGSTHPVQRLFNDLGDPSPHFPGASWDINNPHQNKIWVFNDIDPRFNAQAQQGLPINAIDFVNNFIPTYYFINGQSGYFPAHDESIALVGNAGEPILIRNVHAGMDVASPHVHANHAYVVAVDNVPGRGFLVEGPGETTPMVWWVDTWTMLPGERKDALFPMVVPPDIPDDTWARMKAGAWDPTANPAGTQEYMALTDPNDTSPLNDGHPPSDPGVFTHLAYPMHSHQELSQTANGGNYPMGLITHIDFHGYLPGVNPFRWET